MRLYIAPGKITERKPVWLVFSFCLLLACLTALAAEPTLPVYGDRPFLEQQTDVDGDPEDTAPLLFATELSVLATEDQSWVPAHTDDYIDSRVYQPHSARAPPLSP